MLHLFYQLFIAGCLFFIAICGLMITLAMWKKSVKEFRIDE